MPPEPHSGGVESAAKTDRTLMFLVPAERRKRVKYECVGALRASVALVLTGPFFTEGGDGFFMVGAGAENRNVAADEVESRVHV